MMDLTIRLVEQDDIESLYFIDQSYEYEKYSKNTIQDMVNNPSYKFWVACCENNIIAYISYFCIIDESELIKIVVNQEYRGKGIGHKLMIETMKLLKRNGVKKILLEVRKTNCIAKSLYEKIGFEKIHERQKYYDNNVDAEIYKLSLHEWNKL